MPRSGDSANSSHSVDDGGFYSKGMMKHLAQQGIKSAMLLAGMMRPPLRNAYTYLIYHSVDGRLPIELDLPRALFERQLHYLAQNSQVINYDSALRTLQEGDAQPGDSFILTFDDGYLDFYTTVYPLLQRFRLPAILFVTTGFVEEGVPYPMLSYPQLAVKPLTWDMLGEMVESGLVSLGAHTHTHPVLTGLPLGQIEEELAKPIDLFKERLGIVPQHFCYPRATWRPDIEQLVARHYQSAVIGGGERATAADFHRYRIPRLPVRRSDGWRFFRAKVEGRMANEEMVYSHFRRFLRR
jgi:peptidoglycan/xylan/chitin deacetylase (PgdA/CDA1 family)